MGLCLSLCVGPSMPRVQYDFLSLTRLDIASLSNTYCAIKRNKNGFVEIKNVLKHFHMEGNVFMENSFMLLNRDETKDLPLLNFEEFVYLVWNFSSCDNLAFLAFSIYDTDRENDLNADEADQISKDICGSDEFSSLKNFVPMKFTGINNSFYSQYVRSNHKLLEKLTSMQVTMQQKTLGKSRWKTISNRRNHMSKSSSFIDLFDVLKLLALKTGIKRDFVAISRHLILKDEKRKNTRKVSPLDQHVAAANRNSHNLTQSTSAGSDLQMAGYSEPMQRWLREKMSTTVHTYHPVYRSLSADVEDYMDPTDFDTKEEDANTIKNFDEVQSLVHTDPSVKSEHSRLERKLIRQKSNLSNASGSNPNASPVVMKKKVKRESVETTKNVVSAMGYSSSEDSESDVKDFVDHKFGMIGTPYRRQSKQEQTISKRYSL